MAQTLIAVVGAGVAEAEGMAQAEVVGQLIASQGWVLICGGLGGVMAAACRGGKLAGGQTIGILPGPDPNAANPWVDIAIATGLGEARNTIIAQAAAGLIAVGGEFGTLSEIAFALKLGKPVIGLGTWQLYRQNKLDRTIQVAQDAEMAVALLKALV
ncbi:TIGR00725 family protein [Thermosynechococcaceae cyanobacterium BACA0444]|uniref:TIGR00725 family protein n=1 Tax=Pseudocalidococcus azoricus BACA0444 TaxID=2918990 RepID=A0AAE4FUF8_9CYAN|nr:TIGR00725 family protein [Pseudocalidococcus azoricus]MDS3862396.1 TIGR00725 family protein [Pseudocalidococcus azoricus BACA0444]